MMAEDGFDWKARSQRQRSKGLLRGEAGGGGNATQLPSAQPCQGCKGETTISPCLDAGDEVGRRYEIEKGVMLSLMREAAPRSCVDFSDEVLLE